MRWIPAAATIAFAAWTLPTLAQVHKCKDPIGRTIYSDAPCTVGQSGGLLERRRTHDEIYEERMQAADAENRKQMRRLAEQEREWAAQSQYAPHSRPSPIGMDARDDWAMRKKRANAAASDSSITKNGSSWDNSEATRRARAERQANRRAVLPPPTNLNHCSGGFCSDNQGGQYHRISPDLMTGPNGQACHRTGNMWNCN